MFTLCYVIAATSLWFWKRYHITMTLQCRYVIDLDHDENATKSDVATISRAHWVTALSLKFHLFHLLENLTFCVFEIFGDVEFPGKFLEPGSGVWLLEL